MKLGGTRHLPDANGVESRRQEPVLVKNFTKTDLIAAINKNELIGKVDSCEKASYEIGRALYGRTMDDINESVLEAKTIGNVRIIPDDGQLRTALAFFASPADTAVFHFSIHHPVHHFVLIPWYDDSLPQRRGYTMYMAYSILSSPGGSNPSYNIRQYIARTSGQTNCYKDTWTQDEILSMLRALFSSETAWSQYFLINKKYRAEKISVYKYENIQIQKAVTRLQRAT